MPDPTQPTSFVIGTAGHIDHGKSTLVKALTGTDPDRLAEEKARGMTIELGFAHLETPSGRAISIVDVPGHERFIKNMLAGIGGIDAALLVIAADEGPMPQTVEHLAILDLLQVRSGLVVLTKRDLVDQDWLDLVTEEVREALIGTTLERSPIVPVSAATGEGLPELSLALDAMLDSAIPAPTGTRPRLPIDRVFSVAGFGAVVTGTLTGGELSVGQSIELMPQGRAARIRGLQTHSTSVERAMPGRRVAVNMAGLAIEELRRGQVLAAPGVLRATHRLDALVQLLPSSPVTLEQNSRVDLFVGAAEVGASVTLLDREKLEPGATGWVQFRFTEQLAVLRGDRFIIRRPSPSDTIGGGEVIDPNPIRHRRFRPEVLASLETLAAGSPDEIVLQTLEDGPIDLKTLRSRLPAGLSQEQVTAAIEQLIAEGDARNLSDPSRPATDSDILIASSTQERLFEDLQNTLMAFHASSPLRPGMPREELRRRMQLSGQPRIFDAFLSAAARANVGDDLGATVRLSSFRIQLDPATRALADRFLAATREMPYAPPAPVEFGIELDVLGALTELGELVKVADGVYYDPDAYVRIQRDVLEMIDRDGSITMSAYRDHFQSSRKYAQATLEHLDQRRVTRRVGDERVRFAGSGAARRIGGTE
jgi:selenocysteine-specific elongation factor